MLRRLESGQYIWSSLSLHSCAGRFDLKMIESPKDNVVDADNGAEDPSDRDVELSKLLAEYFQR